MATLTLNEVKKRFGKTEVIHGVSMDVTDGEFIVIVGPSGCGKSTLLRMVAGLETVSDGEVAINGKRVNDLEPMDRDIAMVFQNYALYPHMSVRQNMAYSLKVAKVPKAEQKKKVDEAAKLLQLTDYLKRKPRELSGGQRQRVAMGRAIVRQPAIFLFDEPLSNLDAKLRVQMRLEIKQLQSEMGVTSLYVTHDQVEAMTMADRMIVMNGGVVEQIGTPLEVYERPQSLFAGQFIGSPAMNILDGHVENTKVTLNSGTSFYYQTDHHGPVKVGIRPEHLFTDRDGILTIGSSYVEPLGATTLQYGQLAKSKEPLTISVPGISTPSQQHGVQKFGFNLEHVHLFSADTGFRLN